MAGQPAARSTCSQRHGGRDWRVCSFLFASMSATILQVENDLRANRVRLDAWLANAYSDTPDRKYCGEMDASYPHWHEIETVVGHAFDERVTSRLGTAEIESLLFFVSRSDEIGRIIAWLHPFEGTPFSWVGDLSYDDFIFLCRQALADDDDSCDYQLVSCFQKLATLTQDDVCLLRQFFEEKSDSYTRRLVVHAFSKFKLDDTVSLIQSLWTTDDCEFAKLSCLYALEPFLDARPLFAQYLAEYERRFPVADAEYRQTHMERFREIQAK